MFVAVPIIGTGTSLQDPYRPKLPDGIDYSAHIPTDSTGAPKQTTCLVLVSDALLKPTDATVIKNTAAIATILSIDPTARIDKMMTRGATQVSQSQIDTVLGIAPALVLTGMSRPITRRALFVGGAMVVGGMLVSRPQLAHAARTTSGSDNFNRADNTDIGANWT
ncbi:MAG: hypothetical protein KGP14_12030, partial [Betaproteobacteria bacterium]|nr:hypothetical protein [Betaproteobacteria bacterium]